MSLNSVGLVGVAELRRHSALPIHAHRNGWGLYYRSPHIGMLRLSRLPEDLAKGGAWRRPHARERRSFATNSPRTGASSIASAKSLHLTPLSETDPRLAMPVFSSGQWAGQVPESPRGARLGHDLIYCCGGGIVAPILKAREGGVESIRGLGLWRRSMGSLESRARSKPALAAALSFFQ